MNNKIFLIGYMCSGKTTLGRALAHHLGCRFVDLDEEIEHRAGMSVSEIFQTLGEDRFRQMESDVLADIAGNRSDRQTIVAVGGGTPCFGNNFELMSRAGKTVLLETPVERIVERLILGQDKRPLVAGKKPDELRTFVVKAIETRRPFYERARYRFDSSKLEDEQMIAESVERFIDQFLK